MRQIEFYINGTLADFENLEQLPLKTTKTTDSFTELVGTGGMEIEQIFKTLSFPVTNTNSGIFQADMLGSVGVRGDTRFPYQLFVDGNKISGGYLRLKSIVFTEKGNRFVAETIDSGLYIWEQLETVSLNDIDLGTQAWTQTEIQDSWTETVDTKNGIFAPIIYGALTSTTPHAFHARDFRFSVYYIPILKAIFQKIGYSIESSFFETEIMRNSVYCYSNGLNLKRTEVLDDYQVKCKIERIRGVSSYTYNVTESKDIHNQFNTTTRRFTPDTGGYFTVTIVCKCPLAMIVNVAKNGVSDLYEVETSTGIDRTISIDILLEGSDYVEISLSVEIDLVEGEKMEAAIVFDMKATPVVGSIINVASCLHNRNVKEFLKGVSHQFCGAWYVNEPLKKVYFEPRFKGEYETLDESTPIIERFNGFYSENTVPLDIDVSSFEVEMMKPFGSSLTIGYGSDSSDPIEKHLKGDSSGTPYDCKVTFNERNGKDNINRNPYFTNLYQGTSQAVISSIELPCILPSSFTVGQVLNGSTVEGEVKGEVTFLGSPKCGIVFRGFVIIYLDGTSYAAPLITQHTPYQEGATVYLNYSMCYSNHKKTSDANEVRGLLSLFFLKYFAIMRQAVKLTTTAQIYLPDILQFNFRTLQAVSVDNTPSNFIPVEISDFELLDGNAATFELMQTTEATQTDVEKTVTVQVIAPVVIDISV